MPYEVFTRNTSRLGVPMIGFSKLGNLVFNQFASRLLQKEAVEMVLLLWDSEHHKIAIKTTANKKDPRAYRIRYNEKGNGAQFSCKTFLDYIGIDYSQRRSHPVEINPNSELIVELKVPDEYFSKKPQQPRLVERVAG